MQLWAARISLLVVLMGTPLRQAEAAYDLSRALAELFQAANIETPDGGVGDDSGVGTLNASPGLTVDVSCGVGLSFLPLPTTPAPTPAAEEGLRQRVWWPQAPPSLRHAWLQVFRF